MPNIEIHGYGMSETQVWEAIKLRKRIFEIFKNTNFVRDMVVDIYASSCVNIKEERQPYLRLLTSNSPNRTEDKIIDILDVLDIDLEVCPLSSFRPKKSSRKNDFAILDVVQP